MVDLEPIENATDRDALARAYAACLADVDIRSGDAVGEVRKACLDRRRALENVLPRMRPPVHVTPPAPLWTFWWFWLLVVLGGGAVIAVVLDMVGELTA